MAEENPEAGATAVGGEDEEMTPGYKAPKMATVDELQKLDADDESLVKYKQALLGQTTGVLDEGGPNVLVQKLIFCPNDRDEIVLDLTKDLTILKKNPFVIKEGISYKLKVVFRVQREIVSGLRYVQSTHRKGIRLDKTVFMVGSYGPKTETHVFTTPIDEAPAGMISRGSYTIKSNFTDDDKNTILAWEWAFEIKKEWEK